MKKIVILIILIFSVSVTNAQYNKWAVEAEVGTHQVNSPSIVSEGFGDGVHFGVAGRYNFNPKIGLGLVGGFDNLIASTINGERFDLEYYRLNVEAYVNIFKILDLNPKRFTMLLHGGPGLSWIESDIVNDRVGNISGGITGLYKVSNRVALKLDFTSTGNISQNYTIDGEVAQNTGISSTIHNLSLGAVIYLGKKKDNKDELQPHADWYVKPEFVCDTTLIAPSVTNVTNIYKTYPTVKETNIEEVVKNIINNSDESQFVFFDNDKEDIKDTEYNAIYRAYHALDIDADKRLIIIGYASATNSTSDIYNQKLSERRTNALKTYLIDMGIEPSRITFDSKGKDTMRAKKNVFGVARRVELLIVKDEEIKTKN